MICRKIIMNLIIFERDFINDLFYYSQYLRPIFIVITETILISDDFSHQITEKVLLAIGYNWFEWIDFF